MTQRTKTVKVKAVGILARYPNPGEPFIEDVQTYGNYGRRINRREAAFYAKGTKLRDDRLVDCTITFQLPNRTKKGKP